LVIRLTGLTQDTKYRFPTAVFLLALLVRLIYLWEISSSPGFSWPLIDAQRYFGEALRIASGDLMYGHVAYWQPPLYPWLLGAAVTVLGPNHLLLHLVHFILGAVNCLLLYFLGRKVFSESVGRIAALAACFYGPFLYFEGEYLPPVILVFLSIVLILLILRAAERPRKAPWFLAGLVSGLHIIARPDILLFLPLALVWLVARNIRKVSRTLLVSLIALFTAGVIAPVVPVALRNYLAERVFVPVSYNGGINFYIGNNSEYDRTVATRPGVDWLDLATGPFLQHPVNTAERSEYFFRKSLEWIRECPGEWLRLMGRKIGMFWTGHEFARNLDPYAMRGHSRLLSVLMWDRGIAFPLGVLLPAAILGILFSLSRMRPESGLLLLFALASFWSVVLFFITSRYRIPLVPVLLLFGSQALIKLRAGIRERHLSSWLPPAVGLFALVLLCNSGNPPDVGHDSGEDAYWLGAIATKRGDFRAAREYYHEALLIDPTNIQYHLDLGRSEVALGEVDEAKQQFEWVVNNREEYSAHGMLQAHRLLGSIYRQRGEFAQAEAAYREAIAIAPFRLDSRLMLARVLILRDMYDDAKSELEGILAIDPTFSEAYCGPGPYRSETESIRHLARGVQEGDRAQSGVGSGTHSSWQLTHQAGQIFRSRRRIEAGTGNRS